MYNLHNIQQLGILLTQHIYCIQNLGWKTWREETTWNT